MGGASSRPGPSPRRGAPRRISPSRRRTVTTSTSRRTGRECLLKSWWKRRMPYSSSTRTTIGLSCERTLRPRTACTSLAPWPKRGRCWSRIPSVGPRRTTSSPTGGSLNWSRGRMLPPRVSGPDAEGLGDDAAGQPHRRERIGEPPDVVGGAGKVAERAHDLAHEAVLLLGPRPSEVALEPLVARAGGGLQLTRKRPTGGDARPGRG